MSKHRLCQEGNSRVEKPLREAHLLLVWSDSQLEKLSRSHKVEIHSSACSFIHSFLSFNNDQLSLYHSLQEEARIQKWKRHKPYP